MVPAISTTRVLHDLEGQLDAKFNSIVGHRTLFNFPPVQDYVGVRSAAVDFWTGLQSSSAHLLCPRTIFSHLCVDCCLSLLDATTKLTGHGHRQGTIPMAS